MARIKIDLPGNFKFSTVIPVRITDLNYGGHVGNDTILSIIHEARIQYLKQWGYSELNLAGASLIMADVAIEFKKEVFYGHEIIASVTARDFTKASFDLYYKLEFVQEEKTYTAALAKTGMVCFDYKNRRVMAVPEEAVKNMTGAEKH
ncbi:MAG TPA: thioesterase family protein [Parasegetibacter sp.]